MRLIRLIRPMCWAALAALPTLVHAQPYQPLGNVRFNTITPAQLTADAHNYAPTGSAAALVLRLSADAPRSITGLAGGAAGRPYWLYNAGAQTITLPAESASSTTANRFAVAITLAAGELKQVVYDGTLTRWVPYTGGAGGGSGTVTSVALTVPSGFTVSGSPISTSGTLALTFATGQTANRVLATPDGATGALSLRAILLKWKFSNGSSI